MAKSHIPRKCCSINQGSALTEPGLRYGWLRAISFSHRKNRDDFWLFECDCGSRKVMRERGPRQGKVKSCGCYQKFVMARNAKHGMYGTKLYYVHKSMMGRCYDRNHQSFKDYGGRGITVCKAWRHDKAAFFKWALSNGYKEGLQIERRDNMKGYSPSNCTWVTGLMNSNNKRNNRYLTWRGRTLTYSQWSRIVGLSKNMIRGRILKGWSVVDTLTRPPIPHGERRRKLT